MIRALVFMLVACGPGELHRAYVDAAVDAVDACVEDIEYVWADLDASTPAGSLGSFHYAFAYWWNCGGYVVELLEKPRCAAPDGRVLTLSFHSDADVDVGPEDGDVLPAVITIRAHHASEAEYTNATFTVATFDPPRAGEEPHFAGRFFADAPGWRVDLNFELTTVTGGSCTL